MGIEAILAVMLRSSLLGRRPDRPVGAGAAT
jgi:hypothetical protein